MPARALNFSCSATSRCQRRPVNGGRIFFSRKSAIADMTPSIVFGVLPNLKWYSIQELQRTSQHQPNRRTNVQSARHFKRNDLVLNHSLPLRKLGTTKQRFNNWSLLQTNSLSNASARVRRVRTESRSSQAIHGSLIGAVTQCSL